MCSTERLLELVFDYPELYDLNDKDYKDINKKDIAWQKISEETGTPECELKKKWKNLRDTYSKYLKNLSKTSGKRKKKSSIWRWAPTMERFKPYLSFAQPFIHADTHDNTNTGERESAQHETDDPFYEKVAPYSAEVAFTSREPKKCKRETEKWNETDEVVRYLEKRNSERQNIDAIDHLMLSYAKVIKQFSARGQVKVKSTIAKVIADQELEEIELMEQGPSLTQ